MPNHGRRGIQLGFVAVMAVWLLLPLVLWGRVAADTRHYFIADELLRNGHPEAIYPPAGDPFGEDPAFFRRGCELLEPGLDCTQWVQNFTSPPPALVLGRLISWGSVDLEGLLLRVLSAGALVTGMVALWWRLADRSPRAPVHLLAAAVCLTPVALNVVRLGQTSALMFASACLGLSSDRRGRTVAAAAIFVLAVGFKFTPAVLILVALHQRRWRFVGWSAGFGAALLAATAAIAPFWLYGDFMRFGIENARVAPDNPYSTSLDRLFDLLPTQEARPLGLALRLGTFAIGLAFVIWRARGDSQWALAWAVLLLPNPFVWWHYFWLGFAVVAVVVAERTDRTDTRPVVIAAAAMLVVEVVGFPAPLAVCFLLGSIGYACATLPPRPARPAVVADEGAD